MKSYLPYKFILVLNVCIFTNTLFAQNGTLVQGVIRGTEGPLPSATVQLGNKTVLANMQGEFSLPLRPGSYAIVVTHAGYKNLVRELIVQEGETKSLDFTLIPSGQLGEVVILGSRSVVLRTNLNTPVPVDQFSSKQLLQTGQTGLTQMISLLAPSFNVSRQTLNEPVTLRGLNPDHVLVLLNGTRYHNMAWLNNGVIRGHLGTGAVSNDLNSIPFSAIDKIEILRDGASAQYGSDAIAGVINIRLKKSAGGTRVNLHMGQQYEGDGETVSLGVNHGFDLQKKGFLNLSADFRHRAPTYRGGEYKGTVYRNIDNGQPQPIRDSLWKSDSLMVVAAGLNRESISNAGNSAFTGLGTAMNGGYLIGRSLELSWSGTLNYRTNLFEGGYRFPKNVNLVNTALFPNGFKGRLRPDTWDASIAAGIEGTMQRNVTWAFNSSYGSNKIEYNVENTNNASQYTMGNRAPTRFYTGTLIYQLFTNRFSFSKAFFKESDGKRFFNLGWGLEWRYETYQMKKGEEASWKNYDASGRKAGGSQGGLIVPPDNATYKTRNVGAAYIDAETELNDQLLINLAGRYEYYSDFGGNLAGKLALRYKFSDRFLLRASVSNGYRAPSLQQRYFGSISSGFINYGGNFLPVKTGLYNNESIVSKEFGIPSLKPEKSINIGAGLTSTLFEHLSIAIDAYWIEIRDRIVLSGRFNKRDNPDVANLLASHPDIDQVQFFTNAINTRTGGIDIVLNSNWTLGSGNFTMMCAANFTQTWLFGETKTAGKLPANSLNTNTLFGREERERIQNGQPSDKIILTLEYRIGNFEFLVRNTRFGNTGIVQDAKDKSLDEVFTSKILTDLSISYSPNKWLSITPGVNNLFDVYPDPLKYAANTSEGMYIYAMEASPFGFNGGYYYLAMSLRL